eukprot:Nk52_evm13s293 gene=Nk52_evmTU13s293
MVISTGGVPTAFAANDNMDSNIFALGNVATEQLSSNEPAGGSAGYDCVDCGPNFTISCETLTNMMEERSMQALLRFGGVNGLALCLDVALDYGLSAKEGVSEADCMNEEVVPFQKRRAHFGANKLPPPISKSYLEIVWEAMQDHTLIMLTVAAFISLAVGIYETVNPSYHDDEDNSDMPWLEGVAIILAVIIVVLVGSINDYRQQKQFRKLTEQKEEKEIKVLRGGELCSISVFDVNVGDVVVLDTGDIVCCDGVLLNSQSLECDQSSLTGESDHIKKGPSEDPFVLSGTQIVNGTGKMLVTAVGIKSVYGTIMMSLRGGSESTPLQNKLARLADVIAWFGLAGGLSMLVVLLGKYFAVEASSDDGLGSFSTIFSDCLHIVIQAITIVVVAVPEGLPMAVTLALCYATKRMLKDNNFVRVLKSCETMGGATSICSDKTGTLTQNHMTVVKSLIGDVRFNSFGEQSKEMFHLNGKVLDLLNNSIAVNSTAYRGKNSMAVIVFHGSKSESSLIEFSERLGGDYSSLRMKSCIHCTYPFSSHRKRMGTVVELDAEEGSYRQYVKGAAEVVFDMCTSAISFDGTVTEISDEYRKNVNETITEFASSGLRTLCLAYKDYHEGQTEFDANSDDFPEAELTFLGVVGIQDPVRPEVPEAVEQCKRAGIFVRMVTGDNISTAKHIARECGILTKGGICMEGSTFRHLSEKKMKRIVPNLQVLARCSPHDKQVLVSLLREMGETVAVTGDGTNDGPALKAADVGFSMGISGTDVAKEASDIVLLDDNFASLVKAVMWGRSIYDSVRKFLQFQLTVNVTSVLVAFITAVADPDNTSAITAVQLLWVNLIMDTLAALALATDPPTPALLDRAPHKKSDRLISSKMWKHITGQSIYQLIVCLVLFFLGDRFFDLDLDDSTDKDILTTIVFNTFVFCQIFNEFNARSIDDSQNVFHNILKNRIFIGIWIGTVFVQAIIVEAGGPVFDTEGLDGPMWATSFLLGAVSLPLGALLRVLPEWKEERKEESLELITQSRFEWEKAIDAIMTQLKVVRAFQSPVFAKEQEKYGKGKGTERSNYGRVGASLGSLADSIPCPPSVADGNNLLRARWQQAIRAVRVQLRVCHAFQNAANIETSHYYDYDKEVHGKGKGNGV